MRIAYLCKYCFHYSDHWTRAGQVTYSDKIKVKCRKCGNTIIYGLEDYKGDIDGKLIRKKFEDSEWEEYEANNLH